MTTDITNYPIGTQSFNIIRENNYAYVDKTAYVDRLVSNYRFVFLSRPRRFGKSLLISTLEAFFSNRRELFNGLAIDSLRPGPWEEHAVLHFDFSGRNFDSVVVLTDLLSSILSRMEKTLGITPTSNDPAGRLDMIVRTAYEQTGRGVVILIDEYDNPITSAIGDPQLQEQFRRILYGFYSSFKSLDAYIRFCMLTGVTKYGKISVFSGLNNLKDITFLNDFAGICGITEAELHDNFSHGIQALAESHDITFDQACAELKRHYNGYHFSASLLDVYNPFSILNALADKEFENYWFSTGTPTLLIRTLENLDLDIRKLNGCEADKSELANISSFSVDPKALFFQTGYLTIKAYDKEYSVYTLGFPSLEVESGLMNYIRQTKSHQTKFQFTKYNHE